MRLRSAALAALAAILLAACADNRPPEEIVAERAQARWDALVAGDYREAWAYYSPAFREKTDRLDFEKSMASRPLRWIRAVVSSVQCADGAIRCQALVRVDYEAPMTLRGVGSLKSSSGLTENWLQIQGEWWYSSET